MAIIKTQAFFHSTDGESMLRTLIWRDSEAEPLGIFHISHGLTEHMGRYSRFASFLAENGFIVCGNDHIGHGLSARSMEALGDFGARDSHIRMVDDMHVLTNIMKKKYPNMPYFLFGHDMGAALGLAYAAEFGYELSGLLLSGGSLIKNPIGDLSQELDVIAELLGRDKYSSKGMELLGKLTAKYFKEDDENAWLTISRENREEADADPYFDYPITIGSGVNSIKIQLKASAEETFLRMPPDLPVYLTGGAKDPVTLFGRGVTALCDKLEEYGLEVETVLYPGLRHEILNEDDYMYIYEDILSWTYRALNGDLT